MDSEIFLKVIIQENDVILVEAQALEGVIGSRRHIHHVTETFQHSLNLATRFYPIYTQSGGLTW